MTDKTISDLTAYSSLDPSSDLFPVWDGAAQTTKKLSASQLFSQYIVGTSVDCGTFVDAVTALATAGTECTLVVPSTIDETITGDLTVPAEINLYFERGALITVPTGKTLTINGPIEAGPWQIFSWAGTGAIDISGSPTSDCYIQWWGAVSGTSEDCAAAITKAMGSTGSNQTVIFTQGIWRIASTLSIGSVSSYADRIYAMRGTDRVLSTIYIDVGAGNDGLYLAGAYFDIRDMAFIGPASGCRNGLVVGSYGGSKLYMERVNFYMGASAYALRLSGTTYSKINDIDIGHFGTTYSAAPYSCARPAHGIGFMHPLTYPTHDYDNSAIEVLANISTLTGNGIYMENAFVAKIKGSIESCGYAIYIDGNAQSAEDDWVGVQQVDFDNMYCLDGNTNGLYLNGALHTTLKNITIQAGQSTIGNSRYTNVTNVRFENLTIAASAMNTVLDNVGVNTAYINYAEDTVCLSPVYSTNIIYQSKESIPSNIVNLMTNADFSRFTATVADGWVDASGTWSQESTIVRGATYSAKINTNGSDLAPEYSFSADQLRQLRGQYVSASLWARVSAAPATYGKLFLEVTVPTRANSTGYSVGNCVIPAVPAGYMYKCIVAGTSDSAPPTYPTTVGKTVVDGSVTWQCLWNGGGSPAMTSAVINDWVQYSVSGLIPNNATAGKIYLTLKKGAGGDVNWYLASPCLTTGGWSPFNYVPGNSQSTAGFIQVGAVRLWGATPTVGVWIEVGDVDLSTGQRCTVHGAMGTATWANFP